ncbi:VOC family protein [Streptomyces sp. SID3343]|uniref:VOC family protein n=1 Tax=Streptomyces sp. SID3343 TaxID=2690260 RepID=UPI00136FE620|nr:VOC family protein [Streptomyces sp. SID3343]MYV99783.1 VOC family protein [Streptomyces sp. SID3343]
MPIQLNHTIVTASDQRASAEFLAGLLGLTVGEPLSHFLPVKTDNGVALDYMQVDAASIHPQHYAFLVSDDEFDAILARIRAAGIPYFADPGHRTPDAINTWNGGRATYFPDPDGHNMEILTRSYG